MEIPNYNSDGDRDKKFSYIPTCHETHFGC